MTARLPLAASALFLLTAAQAWGQAAEHAGPANHTLEFIENKGQWDARARYEAQLPGGRLFAEADGLTFSLLADGGPARRGHSGASKAAPPPADSAARGHALKLRFAGAAPATVTAETPTTEHRNYFRGSDAKRWASDVRSYRELRYAGLWPGVSARVYESADEHLEYDFVLAPGARPEAIALRHDGADGLQLDAAGNLLVRTSVGTFTERAPQAWQADAKGQRHAVPCRYVLTGQTVAFDLGKYDHRRPLTIDPVVVFSTYTGSTADNWGFTATYDAQGNLYSGGIVFDVGYPTSLGAYQTFFSGLVDIGVIKYNPNVTGPAARVWATYLGGDGADFPHSLVVNSRGELLILGSTGSTSAAGGTAFPTTAGALQRTFAGGTNAAPFGYNYSPYNSPTGSDLIISRLSANGSALLASTYLGGSGNDGLLPLDVNVSAYDSIPQLAHNYGDPFRGDIIVDAADNVYIATNTNSTDFPMVRGFNSRYRGGTSDGVVCKLNPGLTALTWGSYLGGSGPDAAYSIQLEPNSGDVYVAGGTTSADLPMTAGAYHATQAGNVDGFVTRIAANGTSVVRSSYVGTADYDQAFFLQLGTDGGVYLLGQTLGQFPVTTGLYNTPGGTQFIQKLDANLGQSLLSIVFGDTLVPHAPFINLNPTAFLVDQCDRVYVCGWGGQVNIGYPYQDFNGFTTGLRTTSGAPQRVTDGSDFYLAQFSAGLTSLAFATFYGNTARGTEGEHVDGGTSRFDPRGIVYQAVCSCFSSTGFPIPPGANYYSSVNNGYLPGYGTACNNASFVLNLQPSIANAGSAQTVCATAGPVPLVGTPAGGMWTGPGVTGSAATGFVFTPSLALLGVQTLTYTVISTGACTTFDTRRVTVTAPPTAAFPPFPQQAYCLPAPGAPAPAPVPLTGTPTGGTFSGPGVTGSVAAGFFFTPNLVPGTYQLTYSVTSGTCTATATQAVTVAAFPLTAVRGDTIICAGSTQAIRLRGTPAGGTFSGPGVTGSVATGFFFTPPAGFTGTAVVTYNFTSSAGCVATASQRISTAPMPQPAPTWAPVACPETRLAPLALRFTLAGSGIGPAPSVVWEFGDGTQSAEANPTHTYAAAGSYRPLLRLRYNGSCETQVALPVVEVQERKIPNIITPNGDAPNQFFRLGPDCPPHLQIFSRWGQQVFDSPAYRDDWQAQGQPDGVYYYLLTYPDGHKLKGWVEVVR